MKPKRSKRANTIGNLSEKQKAAYKASQRQPAVNGRPCPGKVAYPGRREAKLVAKKLSYQGEKGRIHAYKCDCGWFHLGVAAAKPQPLQGG